MSPRCGGRRADGSSLITSAVVAALAAGLVLVVIELLRSLPAWLRVRRGGSADGVSAVSTGVLAGTGPGWIAVAVLAPSAPAAVATGVWLVFHLLLWREVARARPDLARRIGAFALGSFLASLVAALLGLTLGSVGTALGVFISVSTAAYSLPALWAGIRSSSTTGLSALSLGVNSIEGLIYLLGGVGGGGIVPAGHTVIGYFIFGLVATISNIPRLVRVLERRLRGLDREQSIT